MPYNYPMTYPVFGQFPTAGNYPSHHGIEIPQLWSKQVLTKFWDRTVLTEITTNRFEGEIKGMGDSLTIRTEPEYQMRPYSMGQPLQYDVPRAGQIVLPIDQGMYWGLQADDVDLSQMDIDWTPRWTSGCGKQLKKVLDTQILAWLPTQVSAETQGATAGQSGLVNLGATTAPVAIHKGNAPDYLIYCGQVLDEMNTPDEGRYVVLPPAYATRLKTSELKAVSVSGDRVSMMRNGYLGDYDKFKVFVSNLLPHGLDTGMDAYQIPFGWSGATAWAGTIDKMETLRAQTFFGTLIRGLYVFGRKVLYPDMVGRLYCHFTMGEAS